SRPQLPQESPCLFFAGGVAILFLSLLLPIRCLFGAEDRCLLGLRVNARPTENICGKSTCLKTPQDYSKEGRLKPFFANNVDIPFARARRLSRARGKQRSAAENRRALTSQFISTTNIKTIIIFDRSSNFSPKNYEKSLNEK